MIELWLVRHLHPMNKFERLVFIMIHVYRDQSIIVNLPSMGKDQNLRVRLPHCLKENSEKQCVNFICASLLARHCLPHQQQQSFVQVITGDEKWCLYAKIKNRKEQLSLKRRAIPRTTPLF